MYDIGLPEQAKLSLPAQLASLKAAAQPLPCRKDFAFGT